jgi:hypothetical protein
MTRGCRLAVMLLLASGTVAESQTVRGSVQMLWTTQEDLAYPWGAQLSYTNGWFMGQIEHVWYNHVRAAQYCAGLVPPDADCSLKRSDIATRFTTILAGIGYGAERWDIRVTGGLAYLHSEWTSLVSNARLSEIERGFLVLGLDTHWGLPVTKTFSVVAGGKVRYYAVPSVDQCIDCAVYYEKDFSGAGVSIGIQKMFD